MVTNFSENSLLSNKFGNVRRFMWRLFSAQYKKQLRWHTSTASSVESYLKSYDSDNIFSKSKLFKLSVPVMINAHLSRYFRETGEIVYTNQELDWSRWPLLKMHMSIFTWSLLFMYFQTLQGSHKIDWLLFLKQRK